MLRRLTLKLAARVEHPLLQLLIRDWRFSCLLLLLAAVIILGLVLPARIWKRTPPGFNPEVHISALDFIQASALRRSARKAEKQGNFDRAIQAWSLALANNPCDQTIAASYIKALLRTKKSDALERALEIAAWLHGFSPGPRSSQLLIAAADQNQNWKMVLQAGRVVPSAEAPPEVQNSIVRALFHTGKYREARDFLKAIPNPRGASHLYREALECILDPALKLTHCATLNENLQSKWPDIKAREIYLITCAEKRNLPEFQKALASIKQVTDQTLAFDVLHVRLLIDLGRWPEARRAASFFRAPKSGQEIFAIADSLVAVGERGEALAFLRGYRSEFNSVRPWVLYARLLLGQANKDELRAIKGELRELRSSPSLETLVAGIISFLDPAPANLSALETALDRLFHDESSSEIWYFSAEALIQAGRPGVACQVLSRIEPRNRHNSEFYSKLFAAAEAKRDAPLMRRVAERRYQLAPNNLRAMANYSAMLAMYEERPDQTVALSARCLRAQPDSLSAKINHAAALINVERFGPADLLLREINEAALSRASRNQLRYIKLKRAIKLGDKSEIRRVRPLIDKSALYSVQIGWLARNHI